MARFKKHEFAGGASSAKLSRANLARLRRIAPVIDEAATLTLDAYEREMVRTAGSCKEV